MSECARIAQWGGEQIKEKTEEEEEEEEDAVRKEER
jgi:hypothetical protein